MLNEEKELLSLEDKEPQEDYFSDCEHGEEEKSSTKRRAFEIDKILKGHGIPKVDIRKAEDRLKTFVKFPTDVPVDPKDLSESGFFSTGKDDQVLCFSCLKFNENWTSIASGSTIDLKDKRWHNEDCEMLLEVAGNHTKWHPTLSRMLQIAKDESSNQKKDSFKNCDDIPSLPSFSGRDNKDSGFFSKPSDLQMRDEKAPNQISETWAKELEKDRSWNLTPATNSTKEGFKLNSSFSTNHSLSYTAGTANTKLIQQNVNLHLQVPHLKLTEQTQDETASEKVFLSPHTSDGSDSEEIIFPESASESQKWRFRKDLDLWKEDDRRMTYSTVDCSKPLMIALAKSGFYCTDQPFRVCCRSCKRQIQDGSQISDVEEEHKQLFPYCRMVLATDKRNIPSKLDLTENIGYTHRQESEKNLNPSLTCVRLSTCDVFESSSEESQVSDCSDTSCQADSENSEEYSGSKNKQTFSANRVKTKKHSSSSILREKSQSTSEESDVAEDFRRPRRNTYFSPVIRSSNPPTSNLKADGKNSDQVKNCRTCFEPHLHQSHVAMFACCHVVVYSHCFGASKKCPKCKRYRDQQR